MFPLIEKSGAKFFEVTEAISSAAHTLFNADITKGN